MHLLCTAQRYEVPVWLRHLIHQRASYLPKYSTYFPRLLSSQSPAHLRDRILLHIHTHTPPPRTMSNPPNMSAPSIPNLLSLRGTRGGIRGRGRGPGRGGHPQSASGQAQHDATIQGTDTDAAVSRLSAVELDYLDDPYAAYFVQGQQQPSRRLPIINRGQILLPMYL